ncbi:MAG: hypothetical protein IJ770_01560 [Alphaproteobacteria bacterium]|nr:hypothetical protein [Alphaproteobacteria bacterium]
MKKENFSSNWGFILTAAGSAIGLGNIWRFPYLCGQYGGLSFILVYLLILLLICNPLMVAEISIGRTAKSNCVDSYKIIGEQVDMKHLGLWSFFGVANIKIFGRDLFTLADWLASTYTATIVSLTMALFVGYKAMKPIIHNIRRSAHVSNGFTRYFLITLRYIAPLGLILLLIMAVLN